MIKEPPTCESDGFVGWLLVGLHDAMLEKWISMLTSTSVASASMTETARDL
jgi:hypothetical protein